MYGVLVLFVYIFKWSTANARQEGGRGDFVLLLLLWCRRGTLMDGVACHCIYSSNERG